MNKESKVNSSYRKHWYNEWWAWSLAGIVVIAITVGIPLVINYMFKKPAPIELFKVEWSSGDALGYYGTIIGSLATIIAVVVTIIFTNKQNRKSELFQRNMIAANNKKIFLEEKYENIFLNYKKLKMLFYLML